MIEGVPATARECAAFIQGVQSAEEAAKQPAPSERVPIERLGAIEWNDFLCIQRLYDKMNELIDRENRMEANAHADGSAASSDTVRREVGKGDR